MALKGLKIRCQQIKKCDGKRESNKRPPESSKCGKVLSMRQSSLELQQVASLSRRRHGFDSRTGRQNFLNE